MNNLQKFIQEQMNLAGLSQRKFAERMGVDDTTLGKVLKQSNPSMPKVDFLVKLAKATNTDIREIIVLVSPDEVVHGSSSSAAALLARLDKLSDEDRDVIDKFISGAVARLRKTNE